MKGPLLVAAVAMLSPLAAAVAAGPFDGTWTGGIPGASRACLGSDVTLVVTAGVASGEAVFPTSKTAVGGKIAADGSFAGKIGPNPTLKGKFEGDNFAGEYFDQICSKGTRALTLHRAK